MQVQHLQQHRPLAPEAARRDLVAAEGRAERGRDLDLELGEVLGAQQPALARVELDDAPGDLALVEHVARGADRPRAAAAARRLSPATISLIVAASSDCTRSSPGAGGLPSGR